MRLGGSQVVSNPPPAPRRRAPAKKTAAKKTTARKPPPKKDMTPEGTATGLEQDSLSRKQLRAKYGYTARQLRVDPDLFNLFQRAFAEQWNEERFDSEVEQLPWYRKNKASVREYLLLEAQGGADFTAKQEDSREFVRRTAMEMGVALTPDEIESLAHDSMMQGWGEDGQQYELQRAIAEMPRNEGDYGGSIAENADMLRAVALANNVKLDEQWIVSKAKSAASGLSLIADAEREVRQMAADKIPVFAQQIMAGQDLDALVSPWRRMMQDEWELGTVPLDDPTLMSAIGGYDESGNPVTQNLGDFQYRLRSDPRWLQTAKGQNANVSAYSGVLKMFGMGN